MTACYRLDQTESNWINWISTALVLVLALAASVSLISLISLTSLGLSLTSFAILFATYCYCYCYCIIHSRRALYYIHYLTLLLLLLLAAIAYTSSLYTSLSSKTRFEILLPTNQPTQPWA